MKIQLQNNYTTPEQSERLIELGVPADSADMYYQNALDARIIPTGRSYKEYTDRLTGLNREIWFFKPCWSVGRLIEIYNICLPEKPYPYYPRFGRYDNMMGIMIDAFVFAKGELNFSKLKE